MHEPVGLTVIVKKSSPKNLLADCQLTVGRLSAVCWPSVGLQTADRFSPKHRLSVGRQSADKRPTVGDVSVRCR